MSIYVIRDDRTYLIRVLVSDPPDDLQPLVQITRYHPHLIRRSSLLPHLRRPRVGLIQPIAVIERYQEFRLYERIFVHPHEEKLHCNGESHFGVHGTQRFRSQLALPRLFTLARSSIYAAESDLLDGIRG